MATCWFFLFFVFIYLKIALRVWVRGWALLNNKRTLPIWSNLPVELISTKALTERILNELYNLKKKTTQHKIDCAFLVLNWQGEQFTKAPNLKHLRDGKKDRAETPTVAEETYCSTQMMRGCKMLILDYFQCHRAIKHGLFGILNYE